MHAIRQHEFGPAENLRYEKVDDPVPGTGQVRIAVSAAGVHLVDTALRAGVHGGAFPLPELPMTPGREVAGVVDAVGPDVDEGWLGRRVVAHLGMASGGYAELALCAATSLHTLPDGLVDDAAVTMIGTGRTAMGVLETAELKPDDVVLVTAAAGGLGGALGRSAFELLGIGGRIILYGWSTGEPTRIDTEDLYSRGLTASATLGPKMLRRRGGLRGLEEQSLAAAATGELVPLVGQSFPLARAADAHTAIETRHTIGKTVLKP